MTPSTTPPDRIAIPREIWILVGAAFVIAIGFGIVSPVLPAYARSFDVGVAAASVIVSAFAFFRLVFAPVGGELVSRLGERPVYLAGLVIVAVSSFATAFAQSYVQLLVFRGLGGIGSTMFTISTLTMLVRLAPPSARGRVSSTYASAFLIGGMIGPVLGGVLAGWGLRLPFIVYGVALVIAAAVVAVGLRGARLRPVDSQGQREVMRLAEAWRSPVYRAVLASAAANGLTNFGVRLAVLPLLAVAVLDEAWVAGAVLAAGAIGTAITLQFSGRLTDQIGRRPLAIGGLVVMGVSMGLLGVAQNPSLSVGLGLTVLFGLSLISGVGAGLVNPAQQAAVADAIVEHLATMGNDVESVDAITAIAPATATQLARYDARDALDLPKRADDLAQALTDVGFVPERFAAALEGMRHAPHTLARVEDLQHGAASILATRYLAEDEGDHLIAVYLRPTGAEGAIARIEQAIHAVDPGAHLTGYSRLDASLRGALTHDMPRIGLAAGVLVLIALGASLRRARDVLLAALVVAAEVAAVLLLIRVLHIPLHIYDALVLPVLLGITVDEGMFLLHHARETQAADVTRDTLAREGPSIAATALTTAAGFGALVGCDFDGLRDLGEVGALGSAVGLVVALIVVPAGLRLREAR
ncbi:MAG: MFS transporter [Terracoccus sp.]